MLANMTRGQQNILAGWCFIVITAAILLFNVPWFISVMHDPVPVTLEQIDQADSPSSLPGRWVSLTFPKLVETDMVISKMQSGVSMPEYKFVAIQTGDRWLLAEVPFDYSGNSIVGYVEKEPDNRVAVRAIERVKDGQQDHRFTPFYLDAKMNMRDYAFILLEIAGFFIFLGVLGLGLGYYETRKDAA